MPSHAAADHRRPRLLASLAAAAVVGIAIGAAGWALSKPAPAEPSGSALAPTGTTPTTTASALPTAQPSAAPSPASPSPEPEQDVVFTLVAAGDILTHSPVLNSALRAGGDTYDFGALTELVRPYIDGADIALCHLEVPIVPEGAAPSGYPMFGAPGELVTALAADGWDGCSLASNHSVDRRWDGVRTTLDDFDEAGLGHSGTARSQDEQLSTQMYTVTEGDRQVDVASISFTYGLNGLPKPDGMPWAVDTFDADAANVQPILEAAQRARDDGADVVVASVHCCVEYRIAPTDAQRSIVEQIAASGLVDLYLGHHAHVPQPIERLEGGPQGEGMWAAFGHGNFLSNQDTQCCVADTNSGYLTTSTITVTPEGDVDVSVEWTATTVDRRDSHTMHVLSDITASGAGNLTASEAAARHQRVADAVGEQASERTTVPVKLADSVTVQPRGE
ncbi:CapA family protein [Demequina sp.]|uniref:CapA family protein n=1 Tax=Demequina sp. TaxID=2050685 RepID=UPI003A85FF65